MYKGLSMFVKMEILGGGSGKYVKNIRKMQKMQFPSIFLCKFVPNKRKRSKFRLRVNGNPPVLRQKLEIKMAFFSLQI